jgi:hypothetical protein
LTTGVKVAISRNKRGNMIGELVEHILAKGFSVYAQKREQVTILRIYKIVGDLRCAVDWALPPDDVVGLMALPDVILMGECNQRLQLLRDEVAKKQMEKSE